MARIFLHSLVGSQKPRRACFPFLQALANKERGDDVAICLDGDAVLLIRDSVMDSVIPVGWPPLKETFPQVVEQGIPLYV